HRLLHGAAANVEADVGLGADLLAEVEELVRAEMIVLHHAAPVRVDHRRPRLPRADAVAPMVLVGKTAAGPADLRRLDLFQRSDDVVADAAGVRNRRVFAHPDALVDAMAEMLREMAVDVGIDDGAGLAGLDHK